MGMQINTNVAALTAYRNLSNTQNSLNGSLEKLSSGLRINRAADDAAGLTISEALKSQVSGLKVAARNAQDGISVVQTAEGALNEVHALLHRQRDLAVQYGNGSLNTEAQTAITDEIQSISDEVARIGGATNFAGTNLLDGTAATLDFQVGTDATQTITVNLLDITGGDVATADGSTDLTEIDAAISEVSASRSGLGATQNRFSSAINTLNVAAENLASAQSRIADTDMASEMANYTRANILTQAGVSMLAQATQSSQAVLKLLG